MVRTKLLVWYTNKTYYHIRTQDLKNKSNNAEFEQNLSFLFNTV